MKTEEKIKILLEKLRATKEEKEAIHAYIDDLTDDAYERGYNVGHDERDDTGYF